MLGLSLRLRKYLSFGSFSFLIYKMKDFYYFLICNTALKIYVFFVISWNISEKEIFIFQPATILYWWEIISTVTILGYLPFPSEFTLQFFFTFYVLFCIFWLSGGKRKRGRRMRRREKVNVMERVSGGKKNSCHLNIFK